jgi:hypothetical protein
MQLACDVIDNCRCYARTASGPQFCGARHGPNVDPCPPACCAGGCDGPEPFAILNSQDTARTPAFPVALIALLILATIFTLVLA